MQRLVFVDAFDMGEDTQYEFFNLPELNRLLEDGWRVKQISPAVTGGQDGYVGGAFVLLER